MNWNYIIIILSSGSSGCRGTAALLWAPPRWPSFSICLRESPDVLQFDRRGADHRLPGKSRPLPLSSAPSLPQQTKAKSASLLMLRRSDLSFHSLLTYEHSFSVCRSWFQIWRWWFPLSKNKKIKSNQMLTNSYYNTISNVTPNICKKKEGKKSTL